MTIAERRAAQRRAAERGRRARADRRPDHGGSTASTTPSGAASTSDPSTEGSES